MAAGPLKMPFVRRAFAAAIALAALLADVTAIVVMVALLRAPATPGVVPPIDAQTTGGLVLGATFSVMGWLIASRRPDNAIGWIFLVIGLSQAVDTMATAAAFYGLEVSPGSLPFASFASWVAGWAWVPGYSLLVTLAVLLFPDGHLPSPRWLPVAWAALAITALLAVPLAVVSWQYQGMALLTAEPGAIQPDLDAVENFVGTLAVPGLLFVAFLSVAGLVWRFHRSRGVERQQLKWFTWAAIVEIGILLATDSVSLGPILGALGGIVVTPMLPVAAAVAILRYRLYDIDRIVSRTLAYAALTAMLVGVYAAGFFILQGILAPFTNGRPVAVAASTLVAFALFQPLRRRVQAVVDRRFYRTRYDAELTVAAFAHRLRDEVDLGNLQAALSETAGGSLGPTRVGVWIRPTPGSPR